MVIMEYSLSFCMFLLLYMFLCNVIGTFSWLDVHTIGLIYGALLKQKQLVES